MYKMAGQHILYYVCIERVKIIILSNNCVERVRVQYYNILIKLLVCRKSKSILVKLCRKNKSTTVLASTVVVASYNAFFNLVKNVNSSIDRVQFTVLKIFLSLSREK